MFIPKHFKEKDEERLLRFMQAHSFATLLSVENGVPLLTHTPALAELREGELWIISHLAKANPQAKVLENGPMTVIFQGPSSYISPSLYEKQQNVPTWNYIAVHATGQATILPGKEEVEALFLRMFTKYDPAYKEQWYALSPEYTGGMRKGMIAFEMKIDRLEGQFKLSQNRSLKERQRIEEKMAASEYSEVSELAKWMQEIRK